MRLHTRIFALVFLVLVVLGGSSSLFLYNSARHNVETDVADRLILAKRSFIDSFENRQKHLISSVQTVVNDWGLRQAIGQQDRQTARDVLINHSNRVGADVAIFVDRNNDLFASTLGNQSELPSALLEGTVAHTTTRHIFTNVGGQHYQLVLSQVKAPVFIGWLGMGFLIDDALAQHFSRLNDVGVSFAYPSASAPEVFASSFAGKARAETASSVNPGSTEMWNVNGDNWEDLVLHHNLDAADSGLVVVLQKSLSEPLAEFRSWWWSLLTIFALIAVFALCMAYVFSRGITRPLNQLLMAIEDMEVGNYSTSIDVQRKDEIGSLSKSFTRMQSAISEREEEIRFRADHDLITDTLNRNGFLDVVEQKISSSKQNHTILAVICLQITHFKEIVDALGHGWGDTLLKLVADRLQDIPPRCRLAHMNSDEFFLSAEAEDVATLFSLAEAVHRALDADFNIRGISLSLTAKLGIAVYPDHATDSQGLLRRASVALNESIQRHQRTTVYDPNLDQNSVRRLTLMSELPKAIKAGQLDLYYQPKVRCAGENPLVDGVECLVRWQHPALGFVPPDDFIGLAEKTGYIVELTGYVLEQALTQCREWRRQNLNLSISVNISAVDLQQASFASRISDLLTRFGVPATSLCLEITESAAMEDPESALRRLTALRNLGVRLSIDDYGTGYSSLAHLKKMPVQELKIDKSFVLELDRNEDDQIIVRSTIELAHNIGLEVIAEGVESERILWQLDQWQCDSVQGYHISKPLPLAEFEEWLASTDLGTKPVVSDIVTSRSHIG